MIRYNWATVGCGVIANELAQALEAQGGRLYSVANRTYDKAKAFAEKYGIEKVYETLDEVFEDENVDIIYISTPHNTHIQYLRKALMAGKHVLCEKSITLNEEELKEANRLAEEHHVILAEAMTLYHMPIHKLLKEKMQSGAFGKLNLIQVNFGSYKEYNMKNRFFNRTLAGGALLDIGVYALSFIRYYLSSAPDQVLSQVKYAETGVDEEAGILLKNPEEEMAAAIISLHSKQPKRGLLSFDRAYVEFYEYPRGQEAVITWTEDGRREVITAGSTAKALEYEVQDMEAAVSGEADCLCREYTADVMRIMTDIRKEWGMKYPEEEQEQL
ncbi:MAG: Gfo/Idh/MocA family oxidoreductase [Lachnospiraceae bacterium]|nr:Gfo/Idh/MocA family oxidoreductase [Lachnospiraceae bacterium]